MREWIEIDPDDPGTLPPDDRRVLCCTVNQQGGKNICLGYYDKTRSFCQWVVGRNTNVVWWMPLPDPPEEE